jgi:protein SCO1
MQFANKTRPKWIDAFVLPLLLIVGVVATIAGLVYKPSVRTNPDFSTASVTPGEVLYAVPAFQFTDRTGKRVSRDDLLNKVWVASFVFIRCTGPCPSVTATMARLQDELKLSEQPDLRFVTFTFDPEQDTPEELAKYADRYRANQQQWLFLTGQEEQLHELAKTGFKLGVTKNSDAGVPVGEKYQHTTYLAVVDRNGMIRGHFPGYVGPADVDGTRFEEGISAIKQLVQRLLTNDNN